MNVLERPATTSRFFEGKLDRLFFWISLLALGLLLFLTIWRQQQINRAQNAYEILQEHHNALLGQLEQLRVVLARQETRIRKLEEAAKRAQGHSQPVTRPSIRQKKPLKDARSLFLKYSGQP
ncbi:MAG: hypothetical protein D6677_05505 [Calditrichaeota bacterium]|nr:MAG: hypothetical protein D6677_05505 [Calditrichota bacterium]